LNNIKFKIMIL